MNNKALITTVNVSKIDGADRILKGITNVGSFEVVVGVDTRDGELGIYFPADTKLSEEYAKANDLVRRVDENGKHSGGFFESNLRVRCQTFRKQRSEGYWAPLNSLAFTKADVSLLKEGDFLDEINGVKLCQKYITPATVRARSGSGSAKVQKRGETPMFKKHFDTPQLRTNWQNIQVGARVIITLKSHGSSARQSVALEDRKLNWFEKTLRFFGVKIQEKEWKHLIGSRNVIIEKDAFREKVAEKLRLKLRKNETVYYEILGYQDENTPIMGRYSVTDKDLKKKYGDEVVFHYGCSPGEFKIQVYRITFTNEDGYVHELSWNQVKNRCEELGVDHVLELHKPFIWDGNTDHLKKIVEECTEGPDPIGLTYPREGCVLRIEYGGHMHLYKHKGFEYRVLEGLVKESDVNIEDMS